MEEAISRLTLALEELDENRRAEELQKSVGANWIKIARAMARFCVWLCAQIVGISILTISAFFRFLFFVFLTISIINTCV